MKQSLYQKLSNLQNSQAQLLSNNWATGQGIYECLTIIFGDEFHVIHPDLSSIYSPASDNDIFGAMNYIKEIEECIRIDGGDLQKPIISIWNTASVRQTEGSINPEAEGGIHWQTLVILPKHYTKPNNEKLQNEHELILFKDSLYSGKTIPSMIKLLFKEKLIFPRNLRDGEIADNPNIEIGGALRDATIIDEQYKDIIQQEEGYDCGWWATYNAFMFVMEGNGDFISQFTAPSRTLGYKLRQVFSELDLNLSEENDTAAQKVENHNYDENIKLAIKNSLIDLIKQKYPTEYSVKRGFIEDLSNHYLVNLILLMESTESLTSCCDTLEGIMIQDIKGIIPNPSFGRDTPQEKNELVKSLINKILNSFQSYLSTHSYVEVKYLDFLKQINDLYSGATDDIALSNREELKNEVIYQLSRILVSYKNPDSEHFRSFNNLKQIIKNEDVFFQVFFEQKIEPLFSNFSNLVFEYEDGTKIEWFISGIKSISLLLQASSINISAEEIFQEIQEIVATKYNFYDEQETRKNLMTHAALGEWIEVKKLIENQKLKLTSLPKEEGSEMDIFHWAADNIHKTQGNELEALFWVVDYFLELGFFPTYGDYSCTAIHHLAYYKETESSISLMRKLLKKAKSKDINSYDGYGKTPLLEAIETGNYHIAKLLIEHPRQDFGQIRIEAPKPLSEYGYYTSVRASAYASCYYHERYKIRDLISQSPNFRQYKPNVELSGSKIKARDILVAEVPHPYKSNLEKFLSVETMNAINGDYIIKEFFLNYIEKKNQLKSQRYTEIELKFSAEFKAKLETSELSDFFRDLIKYQRLMQILDSLSDYQSIKRDLEILDKYFSPTTKRLDFHIFFEVREILDKIFERFSKSTPTTEGAFMMSLTQQVGVVLTVYYHDKAYLESEIRSYEEQFQAHPSKSYLFNSLRSNLFENIANIISVPRSKEDLILYYHSFTMFIYISLKNNFSFDDFNKLIANYKAATITSFKDDILSIVERVLFHYHSNFYFSESHRKEIIDLVHDHLRLSQLETLILGTNYKYYEKHIVEIAHIIFTYVEAAKSGYKLPDKYVYEKSPKLTIELSPIIIKSAENFIDGVDQQISRKFLYNDFAKFFVHLISPKLEFFKLRFSSFSEELYKKYDQELEIELQNNNFFNSEGGLKILSIYNTGSKFKKPAKFIKCCWDFTRLFFQENELNFPITKLEFEKILMNQLEVFHKKRIYLKENLELFNSIRALFLFFKVCSYKPIIIPNTITPIFLSDSVMEQVSATIQDTLLIANAVDLIINDKISTPIAKQFSIMNIANKILTKIQNSETIHIILQTGHPIERGKEYCNHAFYVLLTKEPNNKLNIIIVNGGSNKETDDSYDPIENGFGQNSLCREITVSLNNYEMNTFLKHFIFKTLFLRYEKDANNDDPSQFILDKTSHTFKLIKDSNEDLGNYELGFYLNNESKLYCKYREKIIEIVSSEFPQKLLEKIQTELRQENYRFSFCDKQIEKLLSSKIINSCIVWQNTLDKTIYTFKLIKGSNEDLENYELGFYLNNESKLYCKYRKKTIEIVSSEFSQELLEQIKIELEQENYRFSFADKQILEFLSSKIISSCIVWQNTLDNIYLINNFRGYLEGTSEYKLTPSSQDVIIQNGPHSIASQTAETCTIHNLLQSLKILYQWDNFWYECFINDFMCRYNSFLRKLDDDIISGIATVATVIDDSEQDGAFFFEEPWQDQQGRISLVISGELSLDKKRDSGFSSQNIMLLESDQSIFTRELVLPDLSTDLIRIANYEHRVEDSSQFKTENLRHETVQSYFYFSYIHEFAEQLDLNWQVQRLLHLTDLAKYESIKEKYGITASFDAFRGSNSDFRKSVLLKLHPDKNPGNPDCNDDFIFVTNLREELNKPFDVQNFINEKIQTIQPIIYKANIGFKAFDTAIDVTRLIYTPTTDNAQKTLMDVAHIYSMYNGINGLSLIPVVYEAINEYSKIGLIQTFYKVGPQFSTTLSYMLLPKMIASFGIPHIGFAYSFGLAIYGGLNTIANIQSLYNEFNHKDFKLNSNIAYQNIAEKLSTTYLQNLYDFTSKAKEYEKEAYKIKLEEKGEFGQRLYEYIYSRVIDEKYDLQTNLKAKHIKVLNYDHCMEVIELKEEDLSDHYYCYNEEQQILDHIITVGEVYAQKISSL